ncbi:TPA: hypothetical protein ACH3X2_002876 [Trebouxia sp. C0005]
MSTASGLQILEALSYTVFAGAHSCICSASETLRARFDLQLGLSMSSALKNAVKRKTHKERSQPSDRRKFGLLEKKKDYLQRARDFHKKENEIQNLRRKAEQRNPDEFYFAMERKRTKGGVTAGSVTEANKYSQQELRFMKSQDASYLALKAQTEMKKVDRLRSQLQFIGAAAPRQHVVFVDDQAAVQSFSAEQHFDTPNELLTRSFNRPRTAQLQEPDTLTKHNWQQADRKRAAAYRELQQRNDRQNNLLRMAGSMDMEKAVMGKGRKRKLQPSETGDSQDRVFRWKQVRQK